MNPELTLNTVEYSAEENARRIVAYLEEQGFLLPDGAALAEASLSEPVEEAVKA